MSLSLCAGSTSAQTPFKAQDYLQDGYRDIVVFDFAQLRKTGVWDELNTGAAKLVIGMLESAIGTPLDRIDRFRMVPCAQQPTATGQQIRGNLMITEANEPFAPEVIDEEYWVREKVGDHDLLYRKNFPYGSVSPAPHVRLTGPLKHLRAKLTGARNPGLPCPDIQSLMSARKDGLLCYFVLDLGRDDRRDVLKNFPNATWPKRDPPQFVLLRFLATGDTDDPHIAMEIAIRHLRPGDGLQVTNRAVTDEMEKLIKNWKYRFFAKPLKARKQVIDGSDLSITFDLGRARTAVGFLEMVAAPWLAEIAGETGKPAAPTPAEKPAAAPKHHHK